jgi:TPR repeat protein
MYHRGRGVARDAVQSYMWMSLAAAAGHEAALCNQSVIACKMTPVDIETASRLMLNWQQTHRM